jgi:hypothetical protein
VLTSGTFKGKLNGAMWHPVIRWQIVKGMLEARGIDRVISGMGELAWGRLGTNPPAVVLDDPWRIYLFKVCWCGHWRKGGWG